MTRAPSGRATPVRRGARALTLVELVIAVALLALLMVSVFNLMSSFLTLWDNTENRRALVEESAGVAELFAADAVSMENGPRGDLVVEWIYFDTDANGAADTIWPRVRLMRHATPAEIARLQARKLAPAAATTTTQAPAGAGASAGSDAKSAAKRSAEDEARDAKRVQGEGLLEVCWAVVPAYRGKQEPDRRAEGLILRGERIVDTRADAAGQSSVSFFEPRFFARGGEPTPGVLNEVSGGLLWMGLQFATQTTNLHDGWTLGDGVEDACTSWDGWNRARPDARRHFWNEPGAGMPRVKDRVLLPRRVRLELEFERPRDLKRRTRILEALAPTDGSVRVDDGDRLPKQLGTFVRIDAEWMKLTGKTGERAAVQRAQRGTQAVAHEIGALVHFGDTFVREVPINVTQEDWNL